jgi:hypothetical protein
MTQRYAHRRAAGDRNVRTQPPQSACRACGLALIAALYSTLAPAQNDGLPALGEARLQVPSGDRWYFQTSAATMHFQPEPDHNNSQRLLNVEWQSAGRWVIGGAHFQNSFDQPTQYLYAGRIWRPFDAVSALHLKLTGGLVHGYKGEYQGQIPFNDYGVAPALLPAIGWSWRRFATELVVFGTSGLMWNVGFFVD